MQHRYKTQHSTVTALHTVNNNIANGSPCANNKKTEISAMADYCDPDLMLITETKLDSSIFSSELLPKGYVGEFRRDRNLNGGGVMIVTKDCYNITDLVLQTATQN